MEYFEKIFDECERMYVRGNDKKRKAEYEILSKIKKVLIEESRMIRYRVCPLPLKVSDYIVKSHQKSVRIYKPAGAVKFMGGFYLEFSCLLPFHICLVFRYGDWNQADIEILNKHLFITAKSMIYLVNLSEKDFIRKKNKWLPKIKEYIDKNDPGATVIPFSGTFEQKLMDFETDDERKAYCEETKCTSILDKIVVQGYKALQLQYFFTAGEDEVTVDEKLQLLNVFVR